MLRFTFFALLLVPAAFPQVILEHAIAASGGSVAGVAGKPVSDAASNIMGKASSLLEQAAGTKVAKKEEPRPTAPAATVRFATMPPAPPLPEVMPSEFRAIQIGMKREELLAKVGTPSSRITIPEDSQLAEVYRYRANGTTLGAVRLVDGKVTDVIQ